MELRQFKEYLQLSQLRVLPKEQKRTNKKSWLIILIIAVLIGTIYFESRHSQEGETIESFIEKSLTVKDKQLKYDLCNVTPKQAINIKKLTNIDVSGFKWVIDNYTVRHVLKHKEIKLNDYQKLCVTFNTYDSLKLASKQLQGVTRLEMYKTYERINKLFIEIRKDELYILTMYKTLK